MVICGLARAKKVDIDRAFEAVRPAPRHRIHTFLATSDIHLKHKLKITREQCVEQVRSVPRLHVPLWQLVPEGRDCFLSTQHSGRLTIAKRCLVCDIPIDTGSINYTTVARTGLPAHDSIDTDG